MPTTWSNIHIDRGPKHRHKLTLVHTNQLPTYSASCQLPGHIYTYTSQFIQATLITSHYKRWPPGKTCVYSWQKIHPMITLHLLVGWQQKNKSRKCRLEWTKHILILSKFKQQAILWCLSRCRTWGRPWRLSMAGHPQCYLGEVINRNDSGSDEAWMHMPNQPHLCVPAERVAPN
jgi:hypothetical protein